MAGDCLRIWNVSRPPEHCTGAQGNPGVSTWDPTFLTAAYMRFFFLIEPKKYQNICYAKKINGVYDSLMRML